MLLNFEKQYSQTNVKSDEQFKYTFYISVRNLYNNVYKDNEFNSTSKIF